MNHRDVKKLPNRMCELLHGCTVTRKITAGGPPTVEIDELSRPASYVDHGWPARCT
jgi:hypothetical protein